MPTCLKKEIRAMRKHQDVKLKKYIFTIPFRFNIAKGFSSKYED